MGTYIGPVACKDGGIELDQSLSFALALFADRVYPKLLIPGRDCEEVGSWREAQVRYTVFWGGSQSHIFGNVAGGARGRRRGSAPEQTRHVEETKATRRVDVGPVQKMSEGPGGSGEQAQGPEMGRTRRVTEREVDGVGNEGPSRKRDAHND